MLPKSNLERHAFARSWVTLRVDSVSDFRLRGPKFPYNLLPIFDYRVEKQWCPSEIFWAHHLGPDFAALLAETLCCVHKFLELPVPNEKMVSKWMQMDSSIFQSNISIEITLWT